jgi:predicted phage replisome organizer
MKRLQWIKLRLDLFDDMKIQVLEQMRQSDTLILLWLRLLTLAGKLDDGGLLYLTKDMPLTAKILAKRYGKQEAFIEKALDLYEKLDLMRRDEAGMIQITDWDVDQDTERLNQIREANRRRVAEYRKRQKEQSQENPAEQTQSDSEGGQTDTETGETTADTAGGPSDDSTSEDETVTSTEEDSAGDTKLALNCPTVKYYEQKFGLLAKNAAQYLAEAEAYYGKDRVCRVLDTMRSRGISNIKYLKKVLEDGGGIVVEKETYDERQRRDDQELDEMFRKAEEFSRSHMDGNSHEIAS